MCFVVNKGGEHKNFFSCVAAPLNMFPPKEQVDEYVPPPELHTFTGVFNNLYDQLEVIIPDALQKWYKSYHVIRASYHGDVFEGNACNRLLQVNFPCCESLRMSLFDDNKSCQESSKMLSRAQSVQLLNTF